MGVRIFSLVLKKLNREYSIKAIMSGFQPEDVGSIPSTRSNKFFGSSEAEHLTVNQRVGIS